MKKSLRWILTFAIAAVCVFAVAACASESAQEEAFGEWVVTTLPTCESEGEEMRVSLDDPTHVETRAVSPKGHEWSAWQTVTEPTCMMAGSESRLCDICGNTDFRAIPALGHSFGAWETVREADCDTQGYETRICARDASHTENRTVAALGHDFGDWVIDLAPTCTTAGVERRVCRNCNDHTEVRAVEAYGHAFGDWVITTAPTCTAAGERRSVCRHDASHVRLQSVSALRHDFGDWVISRAPTESEDGEEIHICRRDASHIETRTAYAVGSEGLRFTAIAGGDEYRAERGDMYLLPRNLVIPAWHNGKPVTELGSFSSCDTIETVTVLGNNLRTVRQMAFARCDRLKSVVFPEGVTTIGAVCFTDCPLLKSISFPSTLKSIGTTGGNRYIATVRECPSLETVTVANGSVYYGENNCVIERETRTVVFGTKQSVLPEGIVSVQKYAFFGSDIEEIRIPASVEQIGIQAFGGCKNLRRVTFGKDAAITALESNTFSGCAALESIAIPARVTEIRSHAFRDCAALSSVSFGTALERIESYAFWGCNGLTGAEIPASVSYLSPTALPDAALPDLAIAAENAVYYKDGTSVLTKETDILVIGSSGGEIPSQTTGIGQSAFRGKDVRQVVIPNGVERIGAYAFADCKQLSSVTFLYKDPDRIHEGLKIIDARAFSGCSRLTGITLPISVREIGDYAFEDTSLKSLTFMTFIPPGLGLVGSDLEKIGYGAFINTAPTRFEIAETVTEVGPSAFYGWTQAQTIVVYGFASQEEADAAWGEDWRRGCNAVIEYKKQ